MGSTDSNLGFGLSFALEDRFSGTSQRIQNSFSQLQGGADKMASRIESSMGRIYQGFAQIGAGIGVLMPINSVITAFKEMDSLEMGLTSVMGSAEKARQEIEKLKQSAKAPGLGYREAIEMSTTLQASGLGADLARRSLESMGRALSQVGRGKDYLKGVSLALSQIMSKGKVSAEEIGQLAERIPQIRLAMKNAFGTSNTEALQKMNISSEKFIAGIVKEFEKIPKVGDTLGTSLENFEDAMFRLKVSMGRTLAPFVSDFADKFAKLAESFENFSSSAMGKLTVKLISLFLVITGGGLILKGFASSLSGIFSMVGGYVKVVGVLSKGVSFLGLVMSRDFSKAFEMLTKLSTKLSLATLFNPVSLAIVAFGLAIYGAYKAMQLFDSQTTFKNPALTGFAGILQKIGGILRGIGAIFSSVTDEGWSMSEELYLSLQKIGILETVRAIGTWIVRIRAMFKGFGQAIGESFSWVGNIFKETKDIILSMLGPNISLRIKKIVSDMGMFHNVGHFIGRVFGIIVKVVGVVISLIGLFVGLIVKATLVIYDFGVAASDAFQSAFNSVWNFITSIPNILGEMWSFFKSLVGRAYYIGANFVTSLWDGIKSMWSKFSDWITEKWNNITGMFGGAFSFNNTTPQGDSYSPKSTMQAGTQILSSIAPGRVTTQGAPILSAMASQPKGGTNTVVSKEKLNDISINLLLDGHTLHRSTNNISEFDEARNGN